MKNLILVLLPILMFSLISLSCKKKDEEEPQPESEKNKILKIETVIIDQSGTATGVGYHCRIAKDSNDGLHIVYEDEDNHKLKYAYCPTGGTWQISVIDDCAEKSYAAIEVDNNNGIHLVYSYQDPSKLKYAYKANGNTNWNLSDITGSYYIASDYLDMSVDDNLGIHVVFKDNSGTTYNASYLYLPIGGNWTKESIETIDQTGEEPGIYIKGTNIYVCYGTLSGKLQFSTKTIGSGNWSTQTITSSGAEIMYTNINVNNIDQINVIYRDYADGALKYAEKVPGGNWTISMLDADYGCEFPGIYNDINDTLRISYSVNDEKVRYAYLSPGETSWSIHDVDLLGTDDYYQYTDIISDDKGNTYLCYRRKLSDSSSESVLALAHIYWIYE